ncbi:MAG: GntR family transcriptional regulator [Lachnospiraceae bacterium]|nr:GntR family transcriptional regulator [Lachnospiraceae bacterium]
MVIILNNSSDEPIYRQIVSQIKAHIMSGELAEGEALPSIRVLAQKLRISTITTKRAYEELERDGFIETVGGKGCFVKAQNKEFLREEILRQTEVQMNKVCEQARMGGISLEELKEMLAICYGEDN